MKAHLKYPIKFKFSIKGIHFHKTKELTRTFGITGRAVITKIFPSRKPQRTMLMVKFSEKISGSTNACNEQFKSFRIINIYSS